MFFCEARAMRADRLLSLLLILRQRGRATAPELAAELEVSVRTVMRDLEALAIAGVPVYAERGRHGGYALLAGWSTDVSGLTGPEAQAVLAAGSRSSADALGLGAAFASGLTKLLATMPDEQRRQTVAASSRILVTADGFVPVREATPWLGVLQHAVVEGRRLRVTYQARTGDRPGTRTLDPIGLVHAQAVWYLMAEHRGRPRTYRVGRIRRAVVLDEPAHRDPHVDLAERWRAAQASFRAALTAVGVVVDVADAALARLPYSPDALPSDAPAGWQRVRLDFGDRRQALGVLWSLGPDAVVRSPAWLAGELRARARAMLVDDPHHDRPERTPD